MCWFQQDLERKERPLFSTFWKCTFFHVGDTLCCFDCELMPKLQHIRVAGKFFVGYEIPQSMEHLWKYIGEMYKLDAFTQSCPADQVSCPLAMDNSRIGGTPIKAFTPEDKFTNTF